MAEKVGVFTNVVEVFFDKFLLIWEVVASYGAVNRRGLWRAFGGRLLNCSIDIIFEE